MHVSQQRYALPALKIKPQRLQLFAKTETLDEFTRQGQGCRQDLSRGTETDRRTGMVNDRFQVAVGAYAVEIVTHAVHEAAHGVGPAGGKVVVEDRSAAQGLEANEIAQRPAIIGPGQTGEGQIDHRHAVRELSVGVQLRAKIDGGVECIAGAYGVARIARLARSHRR